MRSLNILFYQHFVDATSGNGRTEAAGSKYDRPASYRHTQEAQTRLAWLVRLFQSSKSSALPN